MKCQVKLQIHYTGKLFRERELFQVSCFLFIFLDDKNEIDKLMWLMKDEKASLQWLSILLCYEEVSIEISRCEAWLWEDRNSAFLHYAYVRFRCSFSWIKCILLLKNYRNIKKCFQPPIAKMLWLGGLEIRAIFPREFKRKFYSDFYCPHWKGD